jgi:hypothetical protein
MFAEISVCVLVSALLSSYPFLTSYFLNQSFIDEKAAGFPTLKLDYPQGAYPVLSLFSAVDSETPDETISIDKWKIDHLVIYAYLGLQCK